MITNARFVRIRNLFFIGMSRDMKLLSLANVGKEKHGGAGSETP
ncbi:hypothetical protein BF29_2504 [Heyndrickxia coagulans DSM 1 = ATCC 7050]|nr:hypothetical protein BF29_2580 [Heyndrickxia coagulans DSM 1 = ATCC 7050]AJH77757.1 hypothetical protein BF29_2504 [Heyndrickxia coagulans DSM 1 = ATCC 7050]SHF74404.1 hypothetical protein SAMN02745208_02599 [Heyndrickxia coagulans DSM 1 = ATCC 7050]